MRAQFHTGGAATEREFDPGGVGVADRVGETFLRDAVDDELRRSTEFGQVVGEPAPDGESGVGGYLGGQRLERAEQSEFFQDAGAQSAGDAADLVQAVARGLLDLVQRRRYGRALGRRRA